MNIQDLFNIKPYSLNKEDKAELLKVMLYDLTQYHISNCLPYRRIIDSLNITLNVCNSHLNLPFLPVRLFKMFELSSVPENDVFKIMNSSGTAGQVPSKIILDKKTSYNQTKALVKIVNSFLGMTRAPMIIIDSEKILKNRNTFSARAAGVLGFSMFGAKKIYALNDQMELNETSFLKFLKDYEGQRILLFGFTYIIYQYFYKQIIKSNLKIDLSKCILIHGGGWKKIFNKSISAIEFKQKLEEATGLKSVHDYYGMVEQTGSIYMECENGCMHASIFSDIAIRRHIDFTIADVGERGIIQTLSVLPQSYPGHSLLTEDEGVLLGEDDCPCGRYGKYFKIMGRLKTSETRGCSDAYTE